MWNVIEDRNAAREYYNARYFFVQQMVEAAKVNRVHLARAAKMVEILLRATDKFYAQRVKFELEYDKKLADGHDMRVYEKSSDCTGR
jgi:hypothetical protein